jgi:hypothetical protein
LIEFFDTDTVELYDLARDPGERCNLANQHPDVALDLVGRLKNWRRNVTAKEPTSVKKWSEK